MLVAEQGHELGQCNSFLCQLSPHHLSKQQITNDEIQVPIRTGF